MTKKIFIRVDASRELGSGHVMRCLTLADRLYELDVDVTFICKKVPGNLINLIERKNYLSVNTLPVGPSLTASRWKLDAEQTLKILKREQQMIDWLVVDHYSLDRCWEGHMSGFVEKIMVIDDLANRRHDCNLLLDQNYFVEENRYRGLVPDCCDLLLGTRYALLNKEFYKVRNSLRQRSGRVGRILVFFGGPDPTNETTKTLLALKDLKLEKVMIDVLIGQANKFRPNIEDLVSSIANADLSVQVSDVAERVAAADLAIGAGGSSTWERHFLGLPAITITTAANQVETVASLERMGTIWNLGWHESVSIKILKEEIDKAVTNPNRLIEMSMKALEISNNYDEDWVHARLL
jgi:UDP-2,4-diacetamido-2,4,6-trideoxy-beta-L-altropyranose hydrolase